jgi:LPS export ABC transporter protein LptC
MGFDRRGAGLAVLFAAAALAAVIAAACAEPPETAGAAETASLPQIEGPRPDSEQWEAVIDLFETGRRQARIEARYMALFRLPERNYTRMDTLEADFFDSEGTRSSHLVARSGEIYNQDRPGRRQVKTWGEVLLTAEEGREVRADTLWWDEARDLVYTFGPFEMLRAGEFIRGTGLEADTRLDSYRFIDASGWSEQGGEWLETEADSTAFAPPDTSGTPAADPARGIPPGITGSLRSRS